MELNPIPPTKMPTKKSSYILVLKQTANFLPFYWSRSVTWLHLNLRHGKCALLFIAEDLQSHKAKGVEVERAG